MAREAKNRLGAEFIGWNVGKCVCREEKGQLQKVWGQMVAGPEAPSVKEPMNCDLSLIFSSLSTVSVVKHIAHHSIDCCFIACF